MRRTVGAAIIWFAINDPMTWSGEEQFAIRRTVLCFNVLDVLHAGAQETAADNSAVSASDNRRHFTGELLRNCGSFAHLVLRAVRKVDLIDRSSDRDSGRKKSSVLIASQTPLQLGRSVLPRQLPLKTLSPQAEEPISLPQALWVEVGCRHAQTIVSGKVPHDYGENPTAAL